MRFVTMFLVALSLIAIADDLSEAEMKQVMDNVSHEYTTCSAYFAVASAALISSGDEETGAKFSQASGNALEYAATAAKVGRTDETALKVVRARLDIEMKQMMNEVDNDASDISILNAEYSDRCVSIMNDIDALLLKFTREIEARR